MVTPKNIEFKQKILILLIEILGQKKKAPKKGPSKRGKVVRD